MTSDPTNPSTCSPESADGPTPSNSPNGQQLDLFGRPVAPARRSAKREKRRRARTAKARLLSGILDDLATQFARTAGTPGRPTSVTFGRTPGDSSPSSALQSSLASRLAETTERNGSPEFEHRWKSRAMLLGPKIYRLRSSGRRSDVNVFSGWPTPMAGTPKTDQYNEAGNTDSSRKTVEIAKQISGWPTPTYEDGNRGRAPARESDTGIPLSQVVFELSGWSTPRANEKHGSPTWKAKALTDQAEQIDLEGWPTPDANRRGGAYTDPEKIENRRKAGHQINLEDAAVLAGWSTPMSRDYKDGIQQDNVPVNAHLGRQVHLIDLEAETLIGWPTPNTVTGGPSTKHSPNLQQVVLGVDLESSPAETNTGESGSEEYRLNPSFSRWLQVPARVGRLRGYGNSIVPQLAALFIYAYLLATGKTTETP